MKDYVTIRVKDNCPYPQLRGLEVDGYLLPLAYPSAVVFSLQDEGNDEAFVHVLGDGEYDLVHESEPEGVFETELKPLYVVEYRNRLKNPDEWVYSRYSIYDKNSLDFAEEQGKLHHDRQYRVRKVLN